MASSLRALALLPFAFALTACTGKLGPEDPAVAVSTGIPMGAPRANGVRFESAVRATKADPAKLQDAPLPLPTALPPDPFDPGALPELKPPGESPAPPTPPIAPKAPKPPKKGMQL